MSTPVVMPQMGESIAEGTIVRWIKKVGDRVDRDEPLFEISTDKVDAEIPSPAAGTLLDISVKEGETVPVNSVVATIGDAGEASPKLADDAARAADGVSPKFANDSARAKVDAATLPPPSGKTVPPKAQADGSAAQSATSVPAAPVAPAASASARAGVHASYGETPPEWQSREGGPAAPERHRSSPLVRKIAKEHGVDISQIAGTGIAGRVTKQDILGYLDRSTSGAAPPGTSASFGEISRETSASARTSFPASYGETPPERQGREGGPAADVEVVPMSIMRKKIAEHMILSRRTSAHVYSVFEVNYSTVDEIRRTHRADYEQRDVKLTFTSFIAKVVVDQLRRHKVINASIDGDNIIYKHEINLGIAVALENGLIVPVVKRADELNLLGLSRAISDVAERARAKKLSPDEVHGGTFTITNPGNFGAQFGLPIINQPQVAILGVGTIEKRPVVIGDLIGIRLMGYLTLGYDHRLVDGAIADQFMADVKKGIENFEPSQV